MKLGMGGGGLLESLTATKSVIPSGMHLIPASAISTSALTSASTLGYHGLRPHQIHVHLLRVGHGNHGVAERVAIQPR
jgi:hypothetical protein